MESPATSTQLPIRVASVFGMLISGVLVGGILGGLLNTINGLISPTYFVHIMRWEGVENIFRAAIAQGIFEGLLFGMPLSLILTAGLAVITKATCTYRFALQILFYVVCGAVVCSVLGSLAAMALATLSPEFYSRNFMGVPEEFPAMLRYAWVGGSIWGLQAGGALSLIAMLFVAPWLWKRHSASNTSTVT